MEDRKLLTARDGAPLVYWLSRPQAAQAPLLVLLHGAASNHTRWSEFAEETSLTQDWRLLRPDLRGNGESMIRGRLDLATWSRDLGELLQAEGGAPAVIVGHSLGAQIAVHFAGQDPRRVGALILIDPVFREALRGKARRRARLMPLYRAAVLLLRLLNWAGLRRRRLPSRDLRELDEETREAMRTEEGRATLAKKYSSLGPILRYMPTANYLQQMMALLEPLPPLESIYPPVLILVSTDVSLTGAEAGSKQMERFPDATIVEIDAEHWPLTEKPVEVREAIENWLADGAWRVAAEREPGC